MKGRRVANVKFVLAVILHFTFYILHSLSANAEAVRVADCERDAKLNVTAAVDGEGFRRSVRSAARWVVRRRTLGEIATFGMNPVVRILERVARCVEMRSAIPPSLRRDWEIFN